MENITEKPHSNHRPIIRYLDEGRQLKINIRVAGEVFTLDPYLIFPRLASHKISTHLIGCPSSGKLEELSRAINFLQQAKASVTPNGVALTPRLLGGSPNEEATKQFAQACLDGKDERALKLLKEHSLPKDLKDDQGNPLICWMAQNEMVATLTCALDKEWNPNLPNKSGVYPLHYAVMKSSALTQALLKAGANPFVTTPKGSTPASVAKNRNNLETLQHILSKNRALDFQNISNFNQSYQALNIHALENYETALLLGDREKCTSPDFERALINKYPSFQKEIIQLLHPHQTVLNRNLSTQGQPPTRSNAKVLTINELFRTEAGGIIFPQLLRGEELEKVGKRREALSLYLELAEKAYSFRNPQVLGMVFNQLGLANYSLGEYRKAIDYHEKDLQIALKIGDPAGEGRACGGLGNAYYSLGEYRKAIDYHEKDLQIALKIGDPAGEGRACGGLGNAYY
ncbi:MAG: tetratricopeptide repeat protein, partial [Candidatus Obscuribacterales bacterium]